MVGIPGKSKGCHTCRRRKIRCTEERPSCGKCIQSGRSCEGYERGAVFLNKTTQGWQKRIRLDEARPRQDSSSTAPNSRHSSDEPTTCQSGERKTKPKFPPLGAVHQPTLLVNTPNMRKQVLETLFLESYLPSSPKSGAGLQGTWLFEALRLSKPGPALENSLHALCITRVGRISGNQDLVKWGTAAYGFALRALRTALESSKLATKDETLASCLILSIYELYESTSNSTSGHEEHMAGIERLVQHRGPRQNDSLLGKALIKNISYASMVKSVQYRKKSRLKDLIDEIQWWDIQGILFAKGHTLGALMEDLDVYKSSGEHSIPASVMYLKRCISLDAEFEKWCDELLDNSPCPIHWTPHYEELGKEDELVFANLGLAHLMLDYWALRLILTTTIDIICSQVPKEIPPSILNMVEGLKAEHGKAKQLEYASNIVSSLPYCMRAEYGLSSSQKCLFSGRVALYALRRYPSEKLPEYEKTYLDLTAKKGLRFARDIDKKEMEKWSPHISEGS